MKHIPCNKSMSMKVRKRVVACYIETVLERGCESWTVCEQEHNSLEASEKNAEHFLDS